MASRTWSRATSGCRSWTARSPWSDWSSFSETGYTVGLAVSESGRLAGPWIQQEEPIYADDGGHPMLFRTFDGRLLMSLHSPNGGPQTRIHFFEMEDTGETLRIVGEYTPGV